jgi:AcrR family transcriptional regulator
MMVEDVSPRTRAEMRRAHLLETARALFIEHGFHQTGVARIATESGIKVGQIYRDFSSKEDIIAAICERDVAEWLEEERLTVAVEAGDVPAVRAWVERFLTNDEPIEECRLMSEIVAEAGRNTRIAELNHRIDRRIRESLSAALVAITGREDRRAERETLIDLILALGIGTMMRRAFDPDLQVRSLFQCVATVVNQRIEALTVSDLLSTAELQGA